MYTNPTIQTAYIPRSIKKNITGTNTTVFTSLIKQDAVFMIAIASLILLNMQQKKRKHNPSNIHIATPK